MGLDNFAARSPKGGLTPEDEEAFHAAGIDLCGGFYSDGVTSFRGKVYHWLVYHITGVSLYEEWIPPEIVRQMSEALNAYTPQELVAIWEELESEKHSEREVSHLQRFFAICAERGLGLIGWW